MDQNGGSENVLAIASFFFCFDNLLLKLHVHSFGLKVKKRKSANFVKPINNVLEHGNWS